MCSQSRSERRFTATYSAGFAPFVSATESEIQFDASTDHSVRYVLRGGRGKHWEPWLSDKGEAVRLGPLFDLPEHKCMVFIGFGDMTTFTLRWLSGDSLLASFDGIPIYNKHETNTPLYVGA